MKNSIIAAKRGAEPAADDGDAYRAWLRRSMPGDFENEFVAGTRRNEALHSLWEETSAAEQPSHTYTKLTRVEGEREVSRIDPERLDAVVRETVQSSPQQPGSGARLEEKVALE